MNDINKIAVNTASGCCVIAQYVDGRVDGRMRAVPYHDTTDDDDFNEYDDVHMHDIF